MRRNYFKSLEKIALSKEQNWSSSDGNHKKILQDKELMQLEPCEISKFKMNQEQIQLKFTIPLIRVTN